MTFIHKILLTLTITTLCIAVKAQPLIEYLHSDCVYGKAQSIFIDYDTNSTFYNKIANFSFGEFDEERYQQSLQDLQQHRAILNKMAPLIPYTKWVKLVKDRDRFCAYHPCDFISHYKASFNDTTFIEWTGEGPEASAITAQKKINNKTYEFSLVSTGNRTRKLTIYIIDVQRQIAVFDFNETVSNEHQYMLMIAADKIRTVPIIVNNCEIQKTIELGFSEPDYKALIKGH